MDNYNIASYFCLKSFESFTSYFCSTTVVSHSNKSCRGSWVVRDSRLSFHLLSRSNDPPLVSDPVTTAPELVLLRLFLQYDTSSPKSLLVVPVLLVPCCFSRDRRCAICNFRDHLLTGRYDPGYRP